MDNSAKSSIDTSGDTVGMCFEERFSVLRNIGGECIGEDKLRLLLHTNAAPVCYAWFVPTPWMNMAQGIMKTVYVNKMVKAGCTVKIFIADWFSQMNYAIGNDLKKIRTIGYYNIEVWRAAGMDLDRVELVWLSDVVNCHEASFWPFVMDICQNNNTLSKIKSYYWKTPTYGLQAKGALLLYLQCAAMLFQKADMWMLDAHQREVSILAGKYCEKINSGNGPIILLNNTLPDLLEYPKAAARCDPTRAISMEDNEDIHKNGKACC